MPRRQEELLWIRSSSWKRMVCVATKCTLKVATPLPIRIATRNAHASMGLADAVFAWRIPRNQSSDGLAFCGRVRPTKKERPRSVGITTAYRDRACHRHRGRNSRGSARRYGVAGACFEDRRGGYPGWL